MGPAEGSDGGIARASTGNSKLDYFLSGGFPRGSLILISGNPGTGKTILSAEFLFHGAVVDKENGIYVSFAEGRRSFMENMRTVGLDFEPIEKDGRFRFLEMFSATGGGMGKVTGDILEAVRRFQTKRLVIDSYSAMSQAMGGQYEGRQVLHTVLSKIVRNLGCTTIVIGEQPTGQERLSDGAEEFVADGVLNLKLTTPRELEIRKMRGTKLNTRAAIYTIDAGFRVLTTELKEPPRAKKWVPIPDSGDLISTGSLDLDAVLGGGLPRGTYAVLESAIEVTIKELRLFTRSLALNFISQKRGVIVVPTEGVSASEVKRYWSPFLAKELFSKYVRIQEQQEPGKRASSRMPPYMVPSIFQEGAGDEEELAKSSETFYSAYKELKSRTRNQPVLRNMGYDSLEASYARFPDRLLNEVGQAVARTRVSGDITLGIAKPTFGLLGKVLGMVDWHFRLTKKYGLLMFQGVKPYTNLYSVDCDVSSGRPVLKLSILT